MRLWKHKTPPVYRRDNTGGPYDRTYVLYYVPRPGEQAVKYQCHQFLKAASARRERERLKKAGIKVAIHAGESHPDPLPFGETLWL